MWAFDIIYVQIMSNSHIPLYSSGWKRGVVNFEGVLNRRIQLRWAAFGKLCDVNIPQILKTVGFE